MDESTEAAIKEYDENLKKKAKSGAEDDIDEVTGEKVDQDMLAMLGFGGKEEKQDEPTSNDTAVDAEMMAMMGFSGFGSSKK